MKRIPETRPRNDTRPPSARFALVLALLATAGSATAQVSPEEHARHHPEQAGAAAGQESPAGEAGDGAGAGAGMGGGMGAGMGDMMKNMGVPPPKELYPTLMTLPDLPLEQRAEVQARAHERMKAGTALLSSGLERLSLAAPGDDYQAMQAALDELRQGVAQFDSGLAAHRALAEGSAPRNVALQWFKRDMSLLPPGPAAARDQLFGLSFFHFFSMFVLVAFAVAMIWMYFLKMRRAQELLRAVVAEGPPAAVAAPAPATPSPAPAETTAAAPASAAPAAAAASPTEGRAPSAGRDKWQGRLRVCRIFQETPEIKTFRLVAADGGSIPFRYLPGQFLTLTVTIDGKPVRRSYTIASSPTVRDYVEITVKREDHGLVSRHLHDTLREGDELEIKAPAGRLTFTGDGADGIVLIGGGVGITPMMSVIRYLTDRGWPGSIHFLYSCKTTRDFVFREELEFLQKRNPNLNVMATMTREEGTVWMGLKGRLTRDLIGSAVKDIEKPPIHICGPPPMMDAIKAMLAELGVPEDHVRIEAFGPAKKPAAKAGAAAPRVDPPRETAAAAATVTFKASGKSGPLGPEETVLDVADSLEVEIDNSCRSGVCGSCAVKLLEGQVSMEVEDGLDPEQKDEGFILACQARSTSSVVIDA